MEFDLTNVVAQQFPFSLWANFKTLVAVSGGPDSVALLHAMVALARPGGKNNLIVVHVDHGTRPSHSAADAEWVRQLAGQLGVEFRLAAITQNTLAARRYSEESLRNRRYQAIFSIAKELGARYIVTGHHLNDQVETILFRLCRGTGLAGAAGIRKYRVVDDVLTLVRPLLTVRRQEIVQYLEQLNQDYRVDTSNQSNDFTRNFLRNEILPALESKFGDVAAAISRFGQQALESSQWIGQQALPLRNSILQRTHTDVRIDNRALTGVPTVLLKSFFQQVWTDQQWPLQSMSTRWWQHLADLTQKESTEQPSLNLPGDIRATFTDTIIVLSKSDT